MTYSPLRDDNITFQVRAIDAAGNVDPTPAERIFTVQRPGTSLQITNGPEDRSTIDADSVTFEWTTDGATPVDSYCQFRGPNGWVELFNSCSSPKTYQLTEDGCYLFNVFVEDATGNSTSMERQFLVDTSTPSDPGRIYFSGEIGSGESEIWSINPDGTGQTNLTNTGVMEQIPSVSPDGSKVVYRLYADEGPTGLFKMDPDGSDKVQLTFGTGAMDASWSPDGTKIAYGDIWDGNIYVMDADGSNVRKVTNFSGVGNYGAMPQWTPDGESLTYIRGSAQAPYIPGCGRTAGIEAVDLDGTNTRMLVDAQGSGIVTNEAFSPGGKMLYVKSAVSNCDVRHLYTANADGSGETAIAAVDGHSDWSPDGSQIVFTRFQQVNGAQRAVFYTMNADGSNQAPLLTLSSTINAIPDWGASPPS